jgi:tol-pal system protein YbgF
MRRLFFIAAFIIAAPALAQEDDAAPTGPNVGQLQVQIMRLEEQMRQMRGQLEQVQFQQRQQTDTQKKANEDLEYRLRTLEQKQAEALAAPAPAPTAAPATEPTTPATYQPEKPAAAAAGKPALTGNDFPNANAHYAAAFDLLNKKKYTDAGTSFNAFVQKYPGDPLTANAYYWLGESYYARSDSTRAAEAFRKGFEANPDGQKAPDNLFKLALSLNNIKRTNEACIVLEQVVNKYGTSNPRTAQRAIDQRVQLQCK